MAQAHIITEIKDCTKTLEKLRISIFALTTTNLFAAIGFFILLKVVTSTEIDRQTVIYCLFLATIAHLLFVVVSTILLYNFDSNRRKGGIRYDSIRTTSPPIENEQIILGDFTTSSNLPLVQNQFSS